MCPRPDSEEEEPPCEHFHLIMINATVAMEMGYVINTKDLGGVFYACEECHQVFSTRELKKIDKE